MPRFNVIHLRLYTLGRLTQAQILALYPGETSATLTTATNTRKQSVAVEL